MPSMTQICGREPAVVFEQPEPRTFTTKRWQVEAAVWGKGPAALMLHGAMGGYDQGILLARTVMPDGFRFIAVSRPGYLGTPLKAGKAPGDQAELCAEVLDVLGVREAVVVAISGGGPAALQFALRFPERCRGLVMISACSGMLDVPIPFQWQVMKLMARVPGLMASMRRKIERDPVGTAQRSIPDESQRKLLFADADAAALHLALRLSTLDRTSKRLAGTENDIRQTRMRMNWELERILSPTLIVHGTADSVVPFAQAEQLRRRVTQAELLAVEGGEHISIFTHRALVRRAIGEFLERL
jgi:pimeloyl-ACP methyl ester carboxylesterase